MPKGGATVRVFRNAARLLEKKFGDASAARIVDYLISSVYYSSSWERRYWRVNQVIGPKSVERFNSDKAKKYYEDKWLREHELSRSDIGRLLIDESKHPQAKYIYMPMEESTKGRLLNSEIGYTICQFSTLGWSPLSESCGSCEFAERCKEETKNKYPEIYRLRIEYGEG